MNIGVEQLQIAHDSGFTGAEWRSYAATMNWTLPDGDGAKEVFVRFRDRAGNISTTYAASITLDTVEPTGAIMVANNTSTVTEREITLILNTPEETTGLQMRLRNNTGVWGSWQPFVPSLLWQLPEVFGQHIVFVEFRDQAGNVSTLYQVTVRYQPPDQALYLPMIRR
jgi:hypothetical protein